MEQFNAFITWLNGYLWGPPMLALVFGTHLFMTLRTGLIQKKIGLGIRLSVTRDPDGEGDVSQFGALMTALASTIGTGNIVGVGTAIAAGGPGALLWLWLTGVFGIATKYSEALIAVKYRVRTENGAMLGGAMYALERGLHAKWLAVLFALFGSVAAFGIGAMVPSNAVATVVEDTFGLPMWISGAVTAFLLALMVLGGIQTITKVCSRLVPVMGLIYIVGCIILLYLNRAFLAPAVTEIVTAAFSPRAMGGGFVGASVMTALRCGVQRGLFSNEAGMGSAPIVAAAARTRNPVRQALVSATGTFWDTVIISAMTGLVLVSSILANPAIDGILDDGEILTSLAFGQISGLGSAILTFGLITFAFSTIPGWSYYGERCAEYLLGPGINIPYRIVYVVITFLGAITSIDLVWNLADALNALMTIPNLIAVLLLSGIIARDTKHYVAENNIGEIDTTPIPERKRMG